MAATNRAVDDLGNNAGRRVVQLLELPPMFIMLVIAVVFFLIFRVLSGPRNRGGEGRLCRGCGASHPGFARFCRRCGKQL